MDPKKLGMVGLIFALIGIMLVWYAFSLEFGPAYKDVADGTSSRLLMTYKLGGIGHMLFGIFLSLLGIMKALSNMPKALAKMKG